MIFASNIGPAQVKIDARDTKPIRPVAGKYRVSEYKNSVRFEPNLGQTDDSVKFLGQGLGYDLFMTSDGAILSFNKNKSEDNRRTPFKNQREPKGPVGSTLRMSFLGSKAASVKASGNETGVYSNYLSKEKNLVRVPSYGGVLYKELYPGVDLVFYSNDQSLEYDFLVRANTAVSTIRIGFEGADKLEILPNGDLLVLADGHEIRHKRPYIYQESAGRKIEIDGKFTIDRNGEVGFALGRYDQSKDLIIDPILTYSTFLGGNGSDQGNAIAADSDGNIFVTGMTASPNFPASTTIGGTPSSSNTSVFVRKYDSSGQLIFSTYWGGAGWDYGRDIKVDGSGNIYVIGATMSANFPTTVGAYQLQYAGGRDAFVSKLNSTGTAFVFSTYLGGDNREDGLGLSLDSSGNVYLAGTTYSANFPTTPGAFQETMLNGVVYAGFVTKLNSSGSSLVYSTYLHGSGPDAQTEAVGIVLDAEDNAVVSGYTNTSDFPTTVGAYQTSFGGIHDAFVAKFNGAGSDLIASTFLGGSSYDFGYGIDIDGAGNIYIVGATYSGDFPTTPGAYQTTHGGAHDSWYDAFIVKFPPPLTAPTYSTFLGGVDDDEAYAVKVDSDGSAFITGITESPNFPTTNDAFQASLAGPSDAFLSKLSPNGNSLLYSTFWGGAMGDYGFGIDLSACGDAYFVGSTRGAGFPIRQAHQPTFGGDEDGFVAKLSFQKTIETAPDASADGPFATTVSEYKLPAAVDTEVLNWQYDHPIDGIQPLQVELWASVYRPATLSGPHPVLVFLHGNHGVCERNSTPEPTPPLPPGVDLKAYNPWYALAGSCDNPVTDTFDESIYFDVVQNHRGYDYLGQNLASWGYVVVSINVNRGIHIGNVSGPDQGLILPRAYMVLRHLQKLKEWNDCTANPDCQSLPHTGVDLRGKLDFSNVGLFGHSRGGQAVRAAYNKYMETGSVWQNRIPGLSIKGIFEIGPTDFETQGGIVPNPSSKFVINGTKWNVLLPMCDSDVSNLAGMNAYDRMLLGLNGDNPASQKSTFTVHGANHNFYNTVWDYHDGGLDLVGDYRCVGNDPLWTVGATGSLKQRQTAISSVVAFFQANVGDTTDSSYNRNFDPRYESPATINNITRVERGFTPSPNTALTTVFEDFSGTINPDNCSSGSNTCIIGGTGVSNSITNILPYHDGSLSVLRVNWNSSGSDKNIQINWRPAGTGVNISTHQTFDFRISRVPDTAIPVGVNVNGATNFSIQLVMADGSLSNAVKLCNFGYVDGPVGGYEPVLNSSYEVIGGTARKRPVLQTIRVPLTEFSSANLTQIRGIKITFDESAVGAVFLTNFRFTKE